MDKQSTTRVYGLIGYPVKHSLSPAMHNDAFRYLKDQGEIDYDAEYRLFEVKPKELEDFLLKKDFLVKDIDENSIYAGDIAGFNITIPHKIKALEILQRKFPFDNSKVQLLESEYDVKLSGAINTVKKEKDRLLYYNTDASGFLRHLVKELGFKTEGKRVLIIGCGGAGRAIIAALSWWKDYKINKIYVNDISEAALNSGKKHFFQDTPLPGRLDLKNRLEFILQEDIPKVIRDCHLLINASPVGMKDEDSSVIDKDLLHKELYIYDLVYNRQTQLIKDAKSLNLPAVNGLGMLLYQGVDAFELWTGQKAPVEIMRKALIEALSK